MEKKTYSVYIHKVNTENGPMYYTGVTTNLKHRWIPSAYKKGNNSLWPYIEQYGWENIEHVVAYETDDREKAYKTEDMLICGYASLGRCINKKRSGLVYTSDPIAYTMDLRKNNPEYAERQRQYVRDRYANDPEYADYQRQYVRYRRARDPEYAEYHRQYNRKWLSTPEGKIYSRVKEFNRYHPDRIVETPLEAKRKYIESGGTIIPDYIKHDDL